MRRFLVLLLLAAGIGALGLGQEGSQDPWPARAVAELTRLLEDPNPKVRALAVHGLGALARVVPELAINGLRIAAAHEDPEIKWEARRALYALLPPKTPFDEVVRRLISVSYEDLMEKGVALFQELLAFLPGEIGNVRMLEDLKRALYEGIWEEQVAAIYCLVELARGWEEALRVLAEALVAQEVVDGTRLHIIEALEHLGTGAVPLIPKLVEVAATAKMWFSEQIRKLFAALGEAAVPKLVEALENPKGTQRKAALEILADLGNKARAAVPAVIRLLEGEPLPAVRVAALATLGAIGTDDPSVVPVLARLARGRDPEESAAALEALAAVGPTAKEALDVVLLLTNHPMVRVRAAAIRALGRLAPAEAAAQAAALLVPLLKDSEPQVREAAAQALGALGYAEEPVLRGLQEALRDPQFAVRVAAVTALGAFGPKAEAALPELLAILVEEDKTLDYWKGKELREAAEEAIKKIGLRAFWQWLAEIPEEEQAKLVEETEPLVRAMKKILTYFTSELINPLTGAFRVPRQVPGLERHVSIHISPQLELEIKESVLIRIEPTGKERVSVQVLTGSLNWDALLPLLCAPVESILASVAHPGPLARQLGLTLGSVCGVEAEAFRQALLSSLKDEMPAVRIAAWTVALRRGLDLPDELWEAGLRDEHPLVRGLALLGGVRLIDDPVRKKDAVVAALGDPDLLVRWCAALGLLTALEEVPKSAVPHLLAMLAEEDEWQLQRLASAALAWAKAMEAAPLILELAVKYPLDWSFPFALAWYGEDLLPWLADLLAHPSPEHREAAQTALFLMLLWVELSPEGLQQVMEILVRMVKHEDPDMRENAVRGLERVVARDETAADRVLEIYIELLNNETDEQVLRGTLVSLATFPVRAKVADRAPELMPILKKIWERHPLLRNFIVYVWRVLGPAAVEALPLFLAEWVARPFEMARVDPDRVLIDMGEGVIPYLLEALADPNLPTEVALWLIEVLGDFGPKAREALPTLFGLLGSGEDKVRIAAVEALVEILTGEGAKDQE
ncbi:MAG: HEAT repeat domain-containing protein [Candidatus Bipolaricaulaceae bacterium]